jgi:hypothetical protein
MCNNLLTSLNLTNITVGVDTIRLITHNFIDDINVMLAAAAMNFKRMMNLYKDVFNLFITMCIGVRPKLHPLRFYC